MTLRIIVKPNGDDSSIATLEHPKTGKGEEDGADSSQIHGITRISTPHKKRSIFAGNTIISDGVIYLATPQDPLFHILPHLKKIASRNSLPSQDILDLLPPALSAITTERLLKAVCDCIISNNEYIPDTYKLSPTRVLAILTRKVDALIPVLGESIQAEYVEKPLALVIGQDPPGNIDDIRSLARRKCAMEMISANLDEEYSQLLFNSTDFTVLNEYLKSLEEARVAAAAAVQLLIPSDPEKRPAKEELVVETKKRKVSQGVKALEKVSKRGMKDMRTFFKKAIVKG